MLLSRVRGPSICYTVPERTGAGWARDETLGTLLSLTQRKPPSRSYNRVCKLCWPPQESEAASESDEGSSAHTDDGKESADGSLNEVGTRDMGTGKKVLAIRHARFRSSGEGWRWPTPMWTL